MVDLLVQSLAAISGSQDDRPSQHRIRVLESLRDIYDIMDRPDFKWPQDVRRKFADQVQCLSKHYGHLAKLAFDAKQCRWSQVSKFHMTAHLPEVSKHLAPRLFWTYGSEPLWA